MSNKVKLGLYVVLTLAACAFGFLSWKNYNRLMTGVQTNAEGSADITEPQTSSSSGYEGYTKAMTFGALFFVVIVGLGLFIGHDLSQYFGNRALKTLYNDEGAGQHDPEYDQAEQVWADGQHLEAIRLMREYLQKNPREQHAALRIAEIYEKDLQNFLAAALEYEEVLKHNLPRERWGWAAIHLCNLYLKLGQPDKTLALLRRIDAEYGETQAAEKARKRLALLEAETGQGNPNVLIEGATPGDRNQPS
jgi:tetratricopeptide (TPR) repeat protein